MGSPSDHGQEPPAGLAICARCAAEKDLPLGRCPGCGHVPAAEERELAIVCSTRILDVAALRAAQERIRRGEPVRPTSALRAQARAVLTGHAPTLARFTPRQVAGLVIANVVLTPLLGYAVWFRYRTRPGPAARQALVATVPVSLALLVALVGWRLLFVSVVETAH
ncbi:MAG: hypothetical protein Q8P18_14515 [Pseudomonadota bacterium]|nr:hypothetical protein [Pseudomonadota bacterium]